MNQGFLENTFAQGQVKGDISLFNRALAKGRRSRIVARIFGIFQHGRDAQHKVSKVSGKSTKLSKVRSVLIKNIRPNEMKDKNFDQNFYPINKESQHRWMSVARARMRNISLPAVELAKVGEAYIVIDGHHRISVAKALGEDFIDAKVRNA